ncbi:MAG TPA: L,D-transpeptidase family protein [Methyloceanibacter sp.]|nr:L,D-transpeptidase family protein [Methyloceanibacter sp.]
MRPIFRLAFASCLVAAVSLPALAAEPDAPDTLIGRSDAIRIAVQNQLSAKFTNASEARKAEQGALVEFYSAPDAKLLWVDENGLTDRGKAAVEEIAKADDYGLRSADYALPKLDGFDASSDQAVSQLAEAEIKIDFAVLDYAHDARGGRIDPQSLSKNLDPTLALPEPSEVLGVIAIRPDPAAYLRSFQPDQPQFEALRQKLIELRGGPAKEETTPAVEVVKIPDGPLLKKGVQNEQVALLRKRLELTSDASNENLFDDAVDSAVRDFQKSRGVAPDGLVGAGTRRLLNNNEHRPQVASNPATIRKLLINMERWRWLPHDLGQFYVAVNIPEFTLRVSKEGKVIHTTKVVVGKTDKQTPVFGQDMQEIVFNPYWNVPNSIKTEEIRPYVTEGGGWIFGGGGWNTAVLDRHNLKINYGGREVDPSTLDWSRIDIRALNIYQPPGPANVLGVVKFVFPNKHDVYMHDTPQRFLFAKPVRAESHGCMRVENPDQLAALLLKQDQGWSSARVASAIQGSYDQHIALQQKIPVYVQYFTLRVNDDGSIATFNDLYSHDARMAAALKLGGAMPPPEPVAFDSADPFPPQAQGQPRQRRTTGRDSWGFDPN